MEDGILHLEGRHYTPLLCMVGRRPERHEQSRIHL
jgi:hypothetical protein